MPSGKASIQLQTTSKTGMQGPQSPGGVHQVSMQQQQPQQQYYQQQQQQYPQGYNPPVQQPQPHQQYQHDVIEPTAVKPAQQFMVYGAPSPQPYQAPQQQYQAPQQQYQPSPQQYQPSPQQYQDEIVEPTIAKPDQQFMVYGAPPQNYQQQPYQAVPQQHVQQHPQQPQQYQPQQPYQAPPQQHVQQHPQQHQPQQYQPQPYQATPQQQHQPQHQQPQQYQPQPYEAAPQQHHQQQLQQPQPQQYQPQPYQAAPQQHHQDYNHPQQQTHQPQPQPYQATTQHQQQPQAQPQQQYHAPPQPYQATPQQHQLAAPARDERDTTPVNASPMPDHNSSAAAYSPPHFVRPLGQAVTVSENEVVHLETQVEPAGDPSIQVEWIKDGKPVVAGSRFNSSYDRGYIVLDILSPMADDSGHYSCVARSNSGQDQTNPITVTVLEEESVITTTQLPEESMMQNIDSLENSWSRPRYSREDPDSGTKAAPAIARQLNGPARVPESARAHFEARVSPPNDATLVVDWFKDGLPLNSSCRFNVIFDRGFVILDIASCIVEDSGDYFFIAKNAKGQVQSSVVHMTCVGGESVITRSVLPESTIDSLNQLDNPESHITHEYSRDGLRYEEESEPDCPPEFVIKPNPIQAEEGNPARFLVKVSGTPMPKVQWLINDSVIGNSNQYHIYRDGAINYLEIRRCKDHDDTKVKVVAWNNIGQSETETTLRVTPAVDFRPGLKHVAPGSNFAKMNRLKKVECSAELAKALSKPRGPTETLLNVEKFSEHKARMHKSNDVVEAEHLYTDVQAKLKPQERGLGGHAGFAAPTKGLEFTDI